MKQYIVFNTQGEITRTGVCQDHLLSQQAGPGEQSIEGVARDTLHYIDATYPPTVHEKTEMQAVIDKTEILSDGADEATISNLPVPCTLFVNGEKYQVEDGEFSLSTEIPGTYAIECRSVTTLAKTFSIEATTA
jgi:hypothetical protein